MLRRLTQFAFIIVAAAWLAGCAGTIQRESNAGSRKIENAHYSAVDVVLTEQARRVQGDRPQFSGRELGDYIRRRLEGRDLLSPQGTHRVEVTIEHVRVRSSAAAVILGFMAGADAIDGYVRVYDARGHQVHGYKVNASYALGGYAGGQDSMRMNWLYEKFSELTVAELAGKTEQTSIAKGRAQPPAAPSAAAPASPAAAGTSLVPVVATSLARPAAAEPQPAPIASGYAAIDDIDAIPYLNDRGRQGYREWLARSTPRAFAISSKGNWSATSGLKPADANLPMDPEQRALLMCERRAKMPCKLYAVNGSVVWVKEPR